MPYDCSRWLTMNKPPHYEWTLLEDMHGCVVWSYPTFPVIFREHSAKTILSCLRLAFKPTVAKQWQNSSFLCPKCTVFLCIQLFWERLSGKVHARIPKGIVGCFEFAVPRNFKEWHERPWTVCFRVLKESNKSRFDSYSVNNSVLIMSHITFRDCRLHIFSDSLSRNTVKFRK